jgi:hypothetical protein
MQIENDYDKDVLMTLTSTRARSLSASMVAWSPTA